jgi:hypothetical protein
VCCQLLTRVTWENRRPATYSKSLAIRGKRINKEANLWIIKQCLADLLKMRGFNNVLVDDYIT